MEGVSDGSWQLDISLEEVGHFPAETTAATANSRVRGLSKPGSTSSDRGGLKSLAVEGVEDPSALSASTSLGKEKGVALSLQ